jgi:uncharacterized damage-inducible protein DinB
MLRPSEMLPQAALSRDALPLDGRATLHSIVQIVNHGTAHRAETGLLLDRLGRSPGDLDYAYYCFEHP